MRGQIQKTSTVMRSPRWALDKQLKDKYLHPSVIRFCDNLSVYRLREITEDSWKIEQEEKSGNGKNKLFLFPSINCT